jgi:hypothetical protein
VFLNGRGIRRAHTITGPVADDLFLLFFNADRASVRFAFAIGGLDVGGRIELDTTRANGSSSNRETTNELTVAAHSLVVLSAQP